MARRVRLPVSALVRDALSRFLEAAMNDKAPQLRFLAAGRSGHRDTAERAEELLWGDLGPHESGSRPRARARRRR